MSRAPETLVPAPDPLTVEWLLGAGLEVDHRYSQQEYAGDLLIAALRESAPRVIEGRLCWCVVPPRIRTAESREDKAPLGALVYDELPVHDAHCERLYKVFGHGRRAGFDMGPPAPVQVLQQ